jgi:hypothetical protein
MKTIKENWEQFLSECIRPDAPQELKNYAKEIFYAGAAAALNAMEQNIGGTMHCLSMECIDLANERFSQGKAVDQKRKLDS